LVISEVQTVATLAATSSTSVAGTQVAPSLQQVQPGSREEITVAPAGQPAVQGDSKANSPEVPEIGSVAAYTESLAGPKEGTPDAAKNAEVTPQQTLPAPRVSGPVVDRKAAATGQKAVADSVAQSIELTKGHPAQSAVAPDAGLGTVTTTPMPTASATPDLNPPNANSKVSPDAQSSHVQLNGKPVDNATAQEPVSLPVKASEADGAKLQTDAESNKSLGSFSGSQGENGDSSFAAKGSALPATNSANAALVSNGLVHKNDAGGAMSANDRLAGPSSAPSADAIAQVEKHAEAVAAYPNTLFQSAKLVERLGQAELRVGFQAGEFGNVDIRTSMARNQFTAQISVERGELSKVLAAELPSLQNRLSEQRLPNTNIILNNQAGGGSAGFEHGSRQSQTSRQITIPQTSGEESLPAAVTPHEIPVSSTRLDVHM
jgi:flagellar hook-length control protein FliK